MVPIEAGSPGFAYKPADFTCQPGFLLRKIASAIGLLHVLPVQTNKMFIMTTFASVFFHYKGTNYRKIVLFEEKRTSIK
jgi:hypothetical protein